MDQEILTILSDINPYAEISHDSKLLEEQILDSLSILLLIEELKTKYNVEIPLETIGIEDFADVSSIVRLMKGLR